MGYYDIASNFEQNRLWWAIEGFNPPDTDDELFAALDAQSGDASDKAAVARAWGKPAVAQRLLTNA